MYMARVYVVIIDAVRSSRQAHANCYVRLRDKRMGNAKTNNKIAWALRADFS